MKARYEAVSWDIIDDSVIIRVTVTEEGDLKIELDEDSTISEEGVISLIEVLQKAKKVIHGWE